MSTFSEDFIEEFHTLPGVTVKEKQQNLYQLFIKNRPFLLKSPETLQIITENLTALNHLERIFRIDYLIYFKQFNELYQEYLNGEEITLSKLAKQEWFFQEVLKKVTAEKFVAEILPNISYAVKLRILKRLPTNEEQSDVIFDAIFKQYGLQLAVVILPKCSVLKIELILKSNLVKFTLSQLKLIYQKNPDLIDFYFAERSKHEGNSNFISDHPILVFIAQKNPAFFAKLFEKYKFNTQLGNRTTKKYVKSQKNHILGKSEAYLDILKKAPLIRKMGDDLKFLFFKKAANSNQYWRNILKYYPKNYQFTLFKSVYNSTFCQEFGQDLGAIDEDMLRLVKEPSEREKIANQMRIKHETDNYLKYVTSDLCFNEFKEKLNQMSSAERIEFVEIATNCFVNNRDLNALLKLCEMVAVRFKNDKYVIRSDFFYYLSQNLDILDEFTEQHWKFILDIIAKAETEDEYLTENPAIRCKYLEYLIRNGKSMKEILSKWNEFITGARYYYIYKKPEILRKILLEVVEIGCPKAKSDESKVDFDCEIASFIREFNEKFPKYKIDISDNQRILESLKKVLTEGSTSYHLSSALGSVICRENPPEIVKELQKLYFENLDNVSQNTKICIWFLKYDPIIFQDNLDHFIKNMPDCDCLNKAKLWRLIKKYSHLKFDKLIVDEFSKKLKDEDFSKKVDLVKALTFLTPADSHLDLVKSYIPTSYKVDLNDNEIKDLYNLQREFIKFLHHLKRPESVLTMTLNFCKGDYLKFALSPLYSSLYRLPENQIKPVLQKINDEEAVSLKKHAMLLACTILGKTDAYNYLKNSTTPNLKPSLKYLAKNPSDSIWDLVEQLLLKLDRKDLSIIQWMEEVTLPLEYKSKYVETAWSFAQKHGSKKMLTVLTTQMDKNVIRKLHPEFVCKITGDSIFNVDNDFVVTLLIDSKDDNKYDLVYKHFKQFKNNEWKTRFSRRKFHSFILSLFEKYIKSEDCDQIFADKISQIFDQIFQPFEAFEEFILVSFMKLKSKGVENYAKFVTEINNTYVKTYSKSVISALAKTIKNFVMPYLFKNELDKIQFVHSVFKHKKSLDDYLLIVGLLPKSEPKYVEISKFYREIVTDLEGIEDMSVRLQFNLYLSSAETEEIDFDWVKKQRIFDPRTDPRIAICPCKP